jgi:hypothetical protein
MEIYPRRVARYTPFLSTTNLASYEALPVSPLCLYSPVFFSPVSYACLATLRVDFFKVLSIQQLNLRY